jgi:hypothetical protein
LAAGLEGVPGDVLLSGAAVDFASDELLFAPPPGAADIGSTPRERARIHPKNNRIRSSVKIKRQVGLESNVNTPVAQNAQHAQINQAQSYSGEVMRL